MLIGVPSSRIDEVFPVVAPMLEKAIRRGDGDFGIEDVRKWIAAKDWQLWVWLEGNNVVCCATTTIVVHQRRKVCSVPLIGGSGLRFWSDHAVRAIADWAKEQGCNCLEGYDPRGAKSVWARALPGWRGVWTVIRKDI